ncbi:MAG TPA: hypothetical protein VK638_29050 [Edaphobacter sp.]|nr:hypothetical protein [Edaphobacter sp.]
MTTKRKPPKKAEPVDISKSLFDALAQKPEPESRQHHDGPVVGDMVTVGSGTSVYTVLSVSQNGREVNLHIPGTNLERFRVPVRDLTIAGQAPRKPKEPEKPQIDKEDVREHLVSTQHSSMHHFEGDIALLKKYLKSKGLPSSTADELDELRTDIEDRWGSAIESIMDKLGG